MLYVIEKQAKRSGASTNPVFKCIITCFKCLAECFERLVKFISKNAFIVIAITGKNFYNSAKMAMNLIWDNAGKFSIINSLGSIFIFLGEIFICASTVFFCYCIFMYADYYRTNLTSPILPLLFICVISFTIGIIFMGVYGMAIDALIICYLFEEKECKEKNS